MSLTPFISPCKTFLCVRISDGINGEVMSTHEMPGNRRSSLATLIFYET